ncbi:MAG: AraC family transcriptional regulator [Myxococcales bacterium]
MQVSLFVVEGLCALLDNRAHVEALLEEAGVAQALRHDARARVDLEVMFRAGYAAHRLTGDAALGLHAAERAPWRCLGLVGALVLQCSSLRHAFAELERYLPLLADRGHLRVHDDGPTTSVWLELPPSVDQELRFVVEYTFTLLARVAREYLGPELGLYELRLPYAEPAHAHEYRRIFGCPVVHGQLRPELVFYSEALDRVRSFTDERLVRVLKEEADATLESEMVGVPVHRRVFNLLKSDPTLWEAGPNKLGKLLGMSSRRLRRRLVSEGKTLSGLLEEARLERARYLLLETDVTIKSIADRLGYSEPSAFHRAFKRWTGQTPAAYKRDQRAILLAC